MRKIVRKGARKSKPNLMRGILGFVLLLVLPLITVVAVQQRQDIRQRAQTTPPPVTINIVDFQFNPGTITVPVGTRVTWINRSTASVPHTTTSSNGTWDSGILNPGGQFSRTFSTAGTFNYHCNVHGAGVMSGTIVVIPNTTGPTSPNTNPPTQAPGELEPTQGTSNPYITPTKPVVQYSPTPIPYGGNDKPVYTCLGSCPTPTPTPTPYRPPAYEAPARGGYNPTPTPKYAYAAPTKVMAYYPTPTPTPKPAAYGYANPTEKPKAAKATPCPVQHAKNASDNTTTAAEPQPANEEGGLFNKIIDLILQIFFKILEMLFGVQPPQKAGVAPAPEAAPGQLEQKEPVKKDPRNPGRPIVVAPTPC